MYYSDTATACPVEKAVLHTLYYFELFSWPLTAREVWLFSQKAATYDVLAAGLAALVEQGAVFQCEEFYLTRRETGWIARRREYEARADRFLPLAHRMAAFIGAFPFVRGVFVSGSLSKHSMAPDGDIDFFIITEPGRLWLSRTLMVLFKKIILFNSHKYFCINYFVDKEHLTIEEKNIFTATEIVTMLPMYGQEACGAFMHANRWARALLPNFPARNMASVPSTAHPGLLKRALEWGWGGWLGRWTDRQAMRLTLAFWRRKFRHLGPEIFDSALKSRPYLSKHHPQHFQQKVLKAYEARMGDANAKL